MEKEMIPSEKLPRQLGNYPNYPTGANGAKVAQAPSPDKQNVHLEKWYDNYEVMEMFHISQRTLQTLRSNGKLPFAKLGNKCFYREQDLQQMMMESFRDSRVKFSAHDTPDDNKEGGGAWQ